MPLSWLDDFESTESVVTTTSVKSYKRGAAHARYKAIREVKYLLQHLAWHVPHDLLELTGLSQTAIYQARQQFDRQTLLQSKTFTVCPTCYSALKPRAAKQNKPPKAGYSLFPCNLCQADTYNSVTSSRQNRKIRHSLSLADTQVWIRTEHPELFI